MYTENTMIELDFRNVIVFISLAIHALLLWILYRYGRKTPGGKAYSVAILAIAGWVLPMTFYRGDFFGETLLWARVLYIMATFTSISFFLFTLVFPEDKKIPWWKEFLLFLENIVVILLILHPTYIIQGVRIVQGGEDIILWGPLYIIFFLHISGYFLAGFVTLFTKLKKAQGVVKQQIALILAGYFFAANLAMITNLTLPWLGYFELNWLGQFFSTLVAIFTTYAILKHNLLNIKVIATESFVLLLNLFLFFQFILSQTPRDFLTNGILLFAVAGSSYLTIRSVIKEVERRQELSNLTASLKKANTRLKELDRQKTEFLSIASHQLRTPLSIIKGYVELIHDGAYGKTTKKMREILGNMDESNERLISLVDEFLDISRIEQGRTKYHFDNAKLNSIVEGVAKELANRAKGKGIEIVSKPDKTIIESRMDEEKIRHVIFNFVDNAIKYSEEGTITIETQNGQNAYICKVSDQGLGFNKEDEANFFQKFYRGKNVEGINVNGNGLGIYVCRKFIEAHGGEVWAKSTGIGKGSEFGFSIPKNLGPAVKKLQNGVQ